MEESLNSNDFTPPPWLIHICGWIWQIALRNKNKSGVMHIFLFSAQKSILLKGRWSMQQNLCYQRYMSV